MVAVVTLSISIFTLAVAEVTLSENVLTLTVLAFFLWSVKTLIRLDGCQECFESSLGAKTTRLIRHTETHLSEI